jgi:hypothetical protein
MKGRKMKRLKVICVSMAVLVFFGGATYSQDLAVYREREKSLVNNYFGSNIQRNYFYPVGFGSEKYFAYFEERINVYKWDKAYQLVVIDLGKNEKIYQSGFEYISNYYPEREGSLDEKIDDPMFSVDKYYSLSKERFDKIFNEYGIKTRKLELLQVKNQKIEYFKRIVIDFYREQLTLSISLTAEKKTAKQVIELNEVNKTSRINVLCYIQAGFKDMNVVFYAMQQTEFEDEKIVNIAPTVMVF